MGIALVRLPAHEVNLIIYAGRITRDEGVRFYSELDPDNPADAARWLTYIDDDADFTDIPVTAFAETKHVLIPKLKRMRERPGYCSAVVCSTSHCEMIVNFWRAYVERDPEYVSHPEFFSNLKDACDWLRLPDAGCAGVADAIRAQHVVRRQAPQSEPADRGPRPEPETR